MKILSLKILTSEQRALAQELGLDIDALSLWSTEYVGFEAEPYLRGGKYRGWIFTSQKAVEAVRPYLQLLDAPPPVAAVGPKTRAALENLGLKVLAYGLNGEALAQDLVERGKTPLAFFCGEVHRPELPMIIRSAGLTLDEVVVYRTMAEAIPALAVEEFGALLFFPTPTQPGNDILGNIFGSKDVSRSVAGSVAEVTGLDEGMLKQMLPILTMAVAGYMAKQATGAASAAPGTSESPLGGILGSIVGGLMR
ncbi:MAG: uroporphyrinogen-III synthase [Bacteroidota bacterium]